jgi:hypothetical protein
MFLLHYTSINNPPFHPILPLLAAIPPFRFPPEAVVVR